MTVFDWLVIAVVGLSGLLALFRGFIREVLSLMTWLVAAFITVHYFADVRVLLEQRIDSKAAVLGLSTVGLFVLVLVLCSVLSAIIMRFLQAGGDLSLLDSALGMVFGVVRGLFILSLAYVMFTAVMPEEEFPDMVTQAKTLPLIVQGAHVLRNIAPGYSARLEEMSQDAVEESDRRMREQAEEQLKQMHKDSKLPEYDGQRLEQLLESLQPEDVRQGTN